jgi:hypothetical protein
MPPSAMGGRAEIWASRSRSVAAVEELIGDAAGRILVGKFEGFGAKPLDADDGNKLIGEDTSDGGGGLQVFETDHSLWAVGNVTTLQQVGEGAMSRANRWQCSLAKRFTRPAGIRSLAVAARYRTLARIHLWRSECGLKSVRKNANIGVRERCS